MGVKKPSVPASSRHPEIVGKIGTSPSLHKQKQAINYNKDLQRNEEKPNITISQNRKSLQHSTQTLNYHNILQRCHTCRQVWGFALLKEPDLTDTGHNLYRYSTVSNNNSLLSWPPPKNNNNQDSEAILDERAQKKDIIKISVKLWTKQLWKQRAKAKLLPGAMPHGYGGTTMQERPLVAHSS